MDNPHLVSGVLICVFFYISGLMFIVIIGGPLVASIVYVACGKLPYSEKTKDNTYQILTTVVICGIMIGFAYKVLSFMMAL